MLEAIKSALPDHNIHTSSSVGKRGSFEIIIKHNGNTVTLWSGINKGVCTCALSVLAMSLQFYIS